MAVRTSEPPYWAVIFSSRRTDPDPDYDAMAARMHELARERKGFLGMETARGEDGLGLTVSYWDSEEALLEWKRDAEHIEAQRRGREEWYTSFEVRVARVERAYSFGRRGGKEEDAAPDPDPAGRPERVPWFDRRFELGRAPEELRELQQRLATGGARLAVMLRGVDDPVLRAKPGGAWSILENLGHLGDLEELWAGRVEDLLSDEDELRAADLENRATHRARHNDTEPQELIDRFTTQRIEWLMRLGEFDEEGLRRTALHPRLKEPMNIVDLCYFVAEHDDHHLETVRELIQRGSG